MSKPDEWEVWLTPHDLDHLNDDAPVFKAGPDGALLTIRTASWDELKAMGDADE